MTKRILTGLSLLLIAALAIAQDEGTPPEAQEFPFDVSNAVVRYDCTFVELNEDGTSDMLKHYRVALLTDRAIRQYAQDITIYNLGYDTVVVEAARVHLPSGEVVEVDPAEIKDVPMPAFGKFYLQNVREKIITFPGLEKGAEIEVQYREITREPPIDGEFSLTEGFESGDPIQTKHVEVRAPISEELRWKLRNGESQISIVDDGDKRKYVWALNDIPQLIPEPGMPPIPQVMSMLLVSTIDNWETWSKWYYELSEPEIQVDDEIRELVNELVEGKSREEAIRQIFYYVSNKIRYVDTALTGKKAGYKPESTITTFRNKYGVCRDKAALMVAMLREAGVESNMVLMNPAWKIEEEVAAGQFNHAIVAVPEGDSIIYIDPTVERTADYLAANEQDRAVLVCTEAGRDLDWTPIEPSEQNLYRIEAASQLDAEGRLESSLTITTKGFPDLILRNHLQSLPPEERQILFKRLVQKIAPQAELNSINFSDPLDFDTPITIELAFQAEKFSVPAGDYLLFQVPGQAGGLEILTDFFLSGSELTARRYNLSVPSTFAVQVQETVDYPDGWKVRSLPEEFDLDYGEYRLAREFIAEQNSVQVKRVLDVSTLEISLDEYGEFQKMLKQRDNMSRGRVVLVKAS